MTYLANGTNEAHQNVVISIAALYCFSRASRSISNTRLSAWTAAETICPRVSAYF